MPRRSIALSAALLALSVAPVHAQSASLLRFDAPQSLKGKEAGLFAVGALLVATDNRTIRWFHRPAAGESPAPLWRTFNTVGDGRTLLPGLVAVGLLGGEKGRRTARAGAAAFLSAGVVTGLIKGLAGRERPYESGGETVFHGPGTSHNSFPSGHTSATAAVMHVLAREYPRRSGLFYGVVGMVALARIHSDRHFVGDTFFGAGIGVAAAEGALSGNAGLLRLRF